MKRKLQIADQAKQDMRNVFFYLKENWPKKVTIDFRRELDRTIQLVHKNPTLFPQSDLSGVYAAVVTKHNSILYSFDERKITVLAVFDTRMNPEKKITSSNG